MRKRLAATVLSLAGLVSCGIPPVDTTYVSSVPANAKSFAIAQKAVRACTDMYNKENVIRRFKNAGFSVERDAVALRGGRSTERVKIVSPDPAVKVLFHGRSCYVGLESMTPKQSEALAKIWARAHDAKSNSDVGDGLSDHVAQAWRRFETEPARLPVKAAYVHRVYIAAYKTWPTGPYDPQNNIPFDIGEIFPKKPGAAVRLSHTIECKGLKSISPSGGVFLPCSRPDYRPRLN